jgi:hypothetical protein
MPWTRHNVKPATTSNTRATSLAAKSGLNLRDLPELMTPEFALKNENYLITTDGGLNKRKGLIKLYEVVGGYPITMLEYWKGYYIFGYNKTVAAYDPVADTVTNIKTNWTTADRFSGAPYGDYFFVGNVGDKIHYVTETGGAFTPTEIAAAPKSGVIRAIGPRLYAGVGDTVYYSDVDAPTTPPFQTWTAGTLATDPGQIGFRNAGTINEICSLGNIIVVFGDTGKWAFRVITQQDGTGVTYKDEEVVIDRVDMGGASGAITTPKGLFYVNEAGLWQLISLGQPNIPFSEQEGLTSILLGVDYFKDIDSTNCDIIYYARYNTVLVTCAKSSVQNNHVIAYNTEHKAFSTFKNWNINRWMNVEAEIYGASSIKTAIYHCFEGNTDDGVAVATDYYQELKCGDLWTRQMLYGMYIKGLLHPLSNITVTLDIFDIKGKFVPNKLKFSWTNQTNSTLLDGWGRAEFGRSSFGGDIDTSGTIENFSGMHTFIRNFQRIRVHITETSKFPHQLNWFSLDARPKANIRRRDLSLTT